MGCRERKRAIARRRSPRARASLSASWRKSNALCLSWEIRCRAEIESFAPPRIVSGSPPRRENTRLLPGAGRHKITAGGLQERRMANLYEILSNAQNGAAIDRLSRQFGLSHDETEQAVAALLP